jgi:hypothetical protein
LFHLLEQRVPRVRQVLAQLALRQQELLVQWLQQALLQEVLPGERVLRSEFLYQQELEQELPPAQLLGLRAGQ